MNIQQVKKDTLSAYMAPTLGVVAISYNEEVDLPGFFDNILSWVDEIVVVDDGSTDGTELIVSNAGPKVKFIKSPRGQNEYYADQRNKGIEVAKSDWLLHMDIDERVSPELATEIKSVLADDTKDGFRFRRLNFFLHRPMRGGGWQNWNLIHLARRELFHFEGKSHEVCVLDSPDERVGQLKNKMWHLNDSSYKERMQKSFSYCQERALDIAERFPRLNALHFICLPSYEFLKKYFGKGGFKDGICGLVFAIHSADAVFRACALAWDKQNHIPREELESKMTDLWKD